MIVRIATANDGEDVAKIYAPIVKDTFISFEDVPPTADEMASRIETTLRTHPWIVIEENGAVVAYAYATPHRSRAAYRWSCNVSVYVGETVRRSGAARMLYQHLFSTLVRQGYANAFAGIALPNDASVGFHEHMGFKPVGTYPRVGFKKGSWRDVGWWSRPLQSLDDTPRHPLPFWDNQDLFKTD